MFILYRHTYSLFLVPLEEILTEGRLVGPGIAAAIIGTGLRGAGGFLESKVWREDGAEAHCNTIMHVQGTP